MKNMRKARRFVLFCAALEAKFRRNLLKEGQMRVILAIFIFCSFVNLTAYGQSNPQLNLMPMPSSVRAGTGALAVTESFSVAIEGYREARLDRAVERFLRDVKLRTGLFVAVQAVEGDKAALVIRAERAGKGIQELGEDESYVLDVSASGAKLTAQNPVGIVHGLQTLQQVIEGTPNGFTAVAVHIEDAPRFP